MLADRADARLRLLNIGVATAKPMPGYMQVGRALLLPFEVLVQQLKDGFFNFCTRKRTGRKQPPTQPFRFAIRRERLIRQLPPPCWTFKDLLQFPQSCRS